MLNLKLPGQLIAIYDERMAIDAIRHGCNVIYVGDPVGGNPQINKMFISGAAFVPNVQAMQILINGDKNAFADMYMKQLYYEPVVHEFLDTVICALYLGKTILFYVPIQAMEFGYHELLFQFIHNVYGIYIQRDANHPYFQEFGYIAVIDALYNFKQIDGIMYLTYIPDVKVNDQEFVKSRLCPMFGFNFNGQETMDYFKHWKDSINLNNKPLTPVISFG